MKYVFNWSGGKDSALALEKCLAQGLDIHCLLTTVSEEGRVSMHSVDNELLKAQAKAINLPLKEIVLPHNCPMETYNNIMQAAWVDLKNEGVDAAIFGDIFLEDLRDYRDKQSAAIGIKNHYPLWKKDTVELAKEFIGKGFKSIVVCVDAKVLGKEFVGRLFDESFLNDLPKGVDPCGENGEFHTYCFEGPIYKKAIPFVKKSIEHRSYQAQEKTDDECFMEKDLSDWNTGFWYQDLKRL